MTDLDRFTTAVLRYHAGDRDACRRLREELGEDRYEAAGAAYDIRSDAAHDRRHIASGLDPQHLSIGGNGRAVRR